LLQSPTAHEASYLFHIAWPLASGARSVASTRHVKERNVKIVDIDRVVDQLLDRVFLPCRQVLAPLCDHGGEQVPARIVFLHPDRGVAGVGLAEQ